MGCRNALFHAVPFAYAGTLLDPPVVGVHHFFQVRVGKKLRRHVAGNSGNLRCNAVWHEPPERFFRRRKEVELYAMRPPVTTVPIDSVSSWSGWSSPPHQLRTRVRLVQTNAFSPRSDRGE